MNLLDLKKSNNVSTWPEYRSWSNMKQLCFNPKAPRYSDYGGRGITVCDKWKNSFEAFYEDIGTRPSPEHMLGRKDTNGNFEPDNCQWVMPEIQQNRKRTNVRYKLEEIEITRGELARKFGLKVGTVAQRTRDGKSLEQLTLPVSNKTKRSITFNGVTKTLSEWAKEYEVDYSTLYNRLFYLKWSFEKAVCK